MRRLTMLFSTVLLATGNAQADKIVKGNIRTDGTNVAPSTRTGVNSAADVQFPEGESFAFGNWVVMRANIKESPYVFMLTAQDGARVSSPKLTLSCAGRDACEWKLLSEAACEKGARISVGSNTQNGFAVMETVCESRIGLMVFIDRYQIDAKLTDGSASVTFAVPLLDGAFKTMTFGLDGIHAARKYLLHTRKFLNDAVE